MIEDNISQLGDYDAPFCEQYTHGSCYISLFKFKSFDQFNPPAPQTASNFRHLLSCGTKDSNFNSCMYTALCKNLSVGPPVTLIKECPLRQLIKSVSLTSWAGTINEQLMKVILCSLARNCYGPIFDVVMPTNKITGP